MNNLIEYCLNPPSAAPFGVAVPWCAFDTKRCSRHRLGRQTPLTARFQKQALQALRCDDWAAFAKAWGVEAGRQIDCSICGHIMHLMLAFGSRHIIWRCRTLHFKVTGDNIRNAVEAYSSSSYGRRLLNKLFRAKILTPNNHLGTWDNAFFDYQANTSIHTMAIERGNRPLIVLCMQHTGVRFPIDVIINCPSPHNTEVREAFTRQAQNFNRFADELVLEPETFWLNEMTDLHTEEYYRQRVSLIQWCCMFGYPIKIHVDNDDDLVTAVYREMPRNRYSPSLQSLQNCCRLTILKSLPEHNFHYAVFKLGLPKLVRNFVFCSYL